MDRRWENSDASYDARNSISDKLSYQDHCDDLEDKSIVHLDNDYLNFHRLLTGQPAKHRPRNLEDELHYSLKKRIDLMFGEDDETPDKNDRGSEIDPDYAFLCDATFEMQEKSCTVQGSVETSKEHAKGREKGDLFHENDNEDGDAKKHQQALLAKPPMEVLESLSSGRVRKDQTFSKPMNQARNETPMKNALRIASDNSSFQLDDVEERTEKRRDKDGKRMLGEAKISRPMLKNPQKKAKEVARQKESSATEQMETDNTIQTDNLAEVQKPKGKAPAKKKKDPAKKKSAAGDDDDPTMENSDENDAVHGLLCLRDVA